MPEPKAASPDQLRRLAEEYLADAEVLYQAARFAGAVYVCGYAVELALKARICRTLNWATFPPANSWKDLTSFKVHKLDTLLILSGQESAIKNSDQMADWSDVQNWNPESQYDPDKASTQDDAKRMITAVKNLLRVL